MQHMQRIYMTARYLFPRGQPAPHAARLPAHPGAVEVKQSHTNIYMLSNFITIDDINHLS